MDIFEMRAVVLKSLAHPARLRILDLLHGSGERCVCEIAEKLQLSQPMTSKHVAMLRHAGLLESRKEGTLVFYRVCTPCLVDFFTCLDGSISRFLQSRQNAWEQMKDQ